MAAAAAALLSQSGAAVAGATQYFASRGGCDGHERPNDDIPGAKRLRVASPEPPEPSSANMVFKVEAEGAGAAVAVA